MTIILKVRKRVLIVAGVITVLSGYGLTQIIMSSANGWGVGWLSFVAGLMTSLVAAHLLVSVVVYPAAQSADHWLDRRVLRKRR